MKNINSLTVGSILSLGRKIQGQSKPRTSAVCFKTSKLRVVLLLGLIFRDRHPVVQLELNLQLGFQLTVTHGKK